MNIHELSRAASSPSYLNERLRNGGLFFFQPLAILRRFAQLGGEGEEDIIAINQTAYRPKRAPQARERGRM